MSMDASKQFTTLDYIDDIKVAGDVFAKPVNEYWALVSLKEGLDFLYKQTVRCNEMMLAQANPKVRIFAMGNSLLLTGVPKGLLTCAFHWYAISACQYVRTVGSIAHKEDKSRPEAWQYLKAVIPEVLTFRNKVAAHYAWTMNHSQDNIAEQSASIMPMLTFSDDSFFIGGYTVSQRKKGKEICGSVANWSITKVHNQLKERYWPEQSHSEPRSIG